MEFGIGYNPAKAVDLIEDLKTTFSQIEGVISNDWEPTMTSIQGEWVGADEQDFELKFAQKMNNLHRSAYVLVYNYAATVATTIYAWKEFQQNNVLTVDGNSNNANTTTVTPAEALELLGVEMTAPSDSYPADVVSRRDVSFGPDTTFGLVNGVGSYDKVVEILTNYVDAVKTAVNNIVNIDQSLVLFGVQQGALNTYREGITEAIKIVITAIKDVKTALETQIKTNYESSDTEMSGALENMKTETEKHLDDNGFNANRWDS